MQQQYMEVAEKLNYLKSEYIRQQTLFNEKITSEKNFLKAESAYKSAKAHHNGLRQKLKMMNINPTSVDQGNISSSINLYAPISGFVTEVKVSNGTFVSPDDEIIEIVNTDHIHLELSVFEKDILKIKKGQQINFKIPEASEQTFKADVHLVGTSVDETNRTIKVHGHIDDEENSFIMGMFVDADILVTSKKGQALPKEAVSEVEGNFYAWILKDKSDKNYTFDKVKIGVGKQSDNFVEVLNIIDITGKQVLIKGGFMLFSEL
jgi:cobalt-zinc-cadmium efflux system membrane fusion protein